MSDSSYDAEIYQELCNISGYLEQIRDFILEIKEKDEEVEIEIDLINKE